MTVQSQHKSKSMIDIDGMWGRICEALGSGSVPEIARKLGLTKQSVYAWQKGKPPALETLGVISKTANASLHWLLTGTGAKTVFGHEASDRASIAAVVRRLANEAQSLTDAGFNRSAVVILGLCFDLAMEARDTRGGDSNLVTVFAAVREKALSGKAEPSAEAVQFLGQQLTKLLNELVTAEQAGA